MSRAIHLRMHGLAVALTALLLIPCASQAQRGGGGRGAGGGSMGAGRMGGPSMGSMYRGVSPAAPGAYYRGGTYYRGNSTLYNRGYYNRGEYSRNYYPYYWRGYYYPYWLAAGLGWGFWGFWPNLYGGPGFGYVDQSLLWDSTQPAYNLQTYPPPPDGQFYPPPTGMDYAPQARVDNTVHISVIVPANAEVWFDQERTSQTGFVREFESPSVSPGRFYSYDIRARWPVGGRNVESVRHITVRAGDRTTVDFSRPPASEKLAMPRSD
jgi:uncharacterized protein (TIGR03000 family)